MSAATDQALLQRLADRGDIENLVKRYARAIDLRDYALLDSCFIPDAELDYSKVGGASGPYPVVRAWLEEVLAPLLEMQHVVSNIVIEVDGDTASGYSYTLNINGMPESAGGGHIVVGAMYTDTFVRTPDGWKFSSRAEERLTMFNR